MGWLGLSINRPSWVVIVFFFLSIALLLNPGSSESFSSGAIAGINFGLWTSHMIREAILDDN